MNAQTAPLLPYLLEPSLIRANSGLFTSCTGWHLSKATSALSPGPATGRLHRPQEWAQTFCIPNQGSSFYFLWSVASEIFFFLFKEKVVIMFSQENESSHLFWLCCMGSRNSPPSFNGSCIWLSRCPTPPNPTCQSREHSSKTPSLKLVEGSF